LKVFSKSHLSKKGLKIGTSGPISPHVEVKENPGKH